MWTNPKFPVDMVTFNEEIVNGKLYILFSINNYLVRQGPKQTKFIKAKFL